MRSALIVWSVAALPALPDNRYTRGSEPSFLSYWKILPLRHLTPPPDIEQTVSRRSEPSSRNSLMGEHPHPWTLLHVQVELSRHRRSKQRRQFELLGATTQLSPGQLFCHPYLPSRKCRGSLDQTFVAVSVISPNTVRLTFALALYIGFLTRLSQPLGPADIFSAGCRPSQTTHFTMSFLTKVSNVNFEGWCFIFRLFPNLRPKLNDYHLLCTTKLTLQHKTVVKFHGVYASRWRSLAFAPVQCVQGVHVRDSRDLVTPFMQVVNKTTRHFATLRELQLFPPFTSSQLPWKGV